MKNDVKSPKSREASTSVREGHFSRRLLPALIASCFACGPVYANPTGGQVVAGQATITSNGNVLTITNTPGSIINWLSFSIGSGQITQFLQQNSNSAVLNRIIGQNPSQIFGSLISNGKVFLINPNGILFEPGSQINVGGLVASSLDISNTDFIAGKHNFSSSVASPGSVVNQGSITTPAGGNIYLIAPDVQNSGILSSPQGDILLAAGHSVQIVDGADPNIQVVVSSPTDTAVNLGQIIAQGGKIGVLGALVNQSGEINADTATVGENGQVVLKSSQTTMVSGNSQTTAVGTGGGTTGGTVELLGPQVGIVDNALVNASGQNGGGKIMVGGDVHGANPAIQNANEIYIGSGTEIKADAILQGNGGQVSVWSYDATRFYGNISAQGGAQSGNGGFVETSGKNYLDFEGLVNTNAAKGTGGTLLLDPYSITIDNSGSSPNAPCTNCVPSPPLGVATFNSAPPNTMSYLHTTALTAQLGYSNVNVTTGTGASGGSIIVGSASPIGWASGKTLTLSASQGITINSAINGCTPGPCTKGNLALYTSSGNIVEAPGGYITNVQQLSAVAPGGFVNLNNPFNYAVTIAGGSRGNFTFLSNRAIAVGTANGYTGITTTPASNGGTGVITLTAYNGSINTAPGATIAGPTLNLSAQSGIGTQAQPLNTSVGSLSANNFYAGSGSGDVVISNTGLPLNVTGITNNVGGSGGIYVISDNAVTVSGAITNSNTITGSNIGIKAGAGIAVNAPISVATGYTVALSTSTGNITEASTASISATNLLSIASAGKVSLTSSYNAVGTVSGMASTGFSLTNSSSITVGAVPSVGSSPTFTSYIAAPNGGGITSSAATGFIALTSTNGGIYVNSPLTVTGGATTSYIALQATANIKLDNNIITGAGTVALGSSAGNILQTGGYVRSGALSAYAGGGYVNLPFGNEVSGIVSGGASAGGFTFNNNQSFNIGYMPNQLGGVLPISGISAPGQNITLTSTGSIGSSGGTIAGGYLKLNAQAGIGSLASPLRTAVSSILATNNTAGSGGGDIVISNVNNSLTIAGITQEYGSGNVFVNNIGNAMTVSGLITASGGDIGLAAGGKLSITGQVTAGSSNTVALMTTSGNITVSANTISAENLSAVSNTGYVSINSPSVTKIGGQAATGFYVHSGTNGVVTDTIPGVGLGYGGVNGHFVPSVTGITSAGGQIYISGSYIGTAGTSKITGPSLNLISANGIGSKTTPLNVNVANLSATNGNTGSGGGDIVISNNGQAMTISGITEIVPPYPYNGNPGDIYIVSNNPVTVSGPIVNNSTGNTIGISANGGLSLGANLTTANGPVVLSASNGDIVQTAGYIAATSLLATNPSGAVALNSTTNNVPIVAGYGSNGFSVASAGSIRVGSAGGTVALGGNNYFAPVTGIRSSGGNIGLSATNGSIVVAAPITAPTTGAVALQAGGGSISQSAVISAGSLSANAAGGVYLSLTNNIDPALSRGTIAGASGTGGFTFNNAQSFNIGTVPAVGNAPAQTGISAPGQTITLTSAYGSIGWSAGTISGTTANISAYGGVGSLGAPLRTAVNNLNITTGLSNTGGGDVAIVNAGTPLTITGITQNNGGNVYVSTNQTLINTGSITTANGNIGLVASGNLTVGNILSAAGASGTIGLQSTGGTVTQTAAITATNLSAAANAGSVVLTNAGNNLGNGGTGTLAGSSGAGGFSVTMPESFNVGSIASVGNVAPQSGITATGQTITLTSTSGSIGWSAGTIAGSTAIINAFGGVGTVANPLATSVSSLSVTNGMSSTGGGDVVISNTGVPLVISGITQNNGGNISVNANNQALTVSGAVTTGAGNIGLIAGGNLALNANVTASGTLTLTSSGGSISSSAGTMSGTGVNLTAFGGIGSQASPINTAVGTLSATNGGIGSGGGDIVVSNTGSALNITGITQNNGGNIFVNANNQPLTTLAISTGNGNIGLVSGGNLTVGALTAAGTDGIVGLQSTGGSITQTAPITAAGLSAVSNAGSVVLTNAGNNITGIVAGTSGAGGFAFSDLQGFSVGGIGAVGDVVAQTGITASGQSVSLTSTAGSIGSTAGTITGSTGTIAALNGVGTLAAPLATSLSNLTVVNGSSGAGGGDVVISNTATPLVIAGITQNNGGNIVVNANTQSLTVGGAVATGNGNVGLVSGLNLAVNAPVNAAGGGIVALQSTGGNISQSAPISANSLSADANTGSVILTNAGNVIGNATTPGVVAGTSGAGGFALTDTQSEQIGTVTAVGSIGAQTGISAAGQNIVLTSSGGNISSAGGTIAGAAATISATSGVGGAGPLDTALSALTVVNGGGNVTISNTGGDLTLGGITQSNGGNIAVNNNAGALTVGGAVTTGNGLVGLTSGGNLALNANVSASGTLTLTSTNGNISASGGTAAGAGATISAFGGVGSQAAPLATTVTTLSVTNGTNGAGGGDIAISNSAKPLTVSGIIQSNGGNIYVNANNEPLTVGGAVTTGNGDVGLLSGGNLAVNAPVTATGTNGIVALESTAGNVTQTAAITATSLSAVAGAGSVLLNDIANRAGTVAGSAAGEGGFEFDSAAGFTVGNVALAGPTYVGGYLIPAVSGVTTNGPVKLDPTSNGDININAPINAGAGAVTITAAGGSIVQGALGSITTTGTLTLDAAQNVGGTGAAGAGVAGGALQTNVGVLNVNDGGNVYISNAGTGNLTVNQILGSGIVNVSTAGDMTVPAGTGSTSFTGSAITLVSAGNMSLGANNTYSAAGGTGPITLYAGFNETAGSVPLANGSSSFLSQGGTFNGGSINLWANSYVDFIGEATYSTTQVYHPGPTIVDVSVQGETVQTKTYDGKTTATIVGGTLVGIPSFDLPLVSFTLSGTFTSANAGTGIPVGATLTLVLPASLAAEFVPVQPSGLTGTIIPAVLTVTNQAALSKFSDGTNTAIVYGGMLSGLIANDAGSVTLTQSGHFAQTAAGANIQIVATDSISGTGASNYTLTQPTYMVADIISLPALNQTPILFSANQNYIVGLNFASGFASDDKRIDKRFSQNSGSSYYVTFNSGIFDHETETNLYCN